MPTTDEPTGDDFVRTTDLGTGREDWEEYYTRIYAPEEKKERLVNFGEASLRLGPQLDGNTLRHHGMVILAGPPGTGKTTLAKGTANRLAQRLDFPVQFRELETPDLFSSGFGDTPQLVAEAFGTIQEDALDRDTVQVVLFDEVESLFSNRDMLAGDTDPHDAVRAVNQALDRIDALADEPNVYAVATSNQPDAVDRAFQSRSDEQIHIGNPAPKYRAAILTDTFRYLNSSIGTELPAEPGQMDTLVELSAGLSGRRIRKLVFAAIATDRDNILAPEQMTVADVEAAFEAKQEAKDKGDRNYVRLGSEPEAETGSDSAPDRDRSADEPVEAESTGPAAGGKPGRDRSPGQRDEQKREPKMRSDESPDGDQSEKTAGESPTAEAERDDGVTELEPRRVVCDSTQRKPEAALLTDVQTFGQQVAEVTGYDPDAVETAFADESVMQQVTELSYARRLDRVDVRVGEFRIPIEVSDEIGGRSNLREPAEGVLSGEAPSGPLIFTLVTDRPEDTAEPTLVKVGQSGRGSTSERSVEVTVRNEGGGD